MTSPPRDATVSTSPVSINHSPVRRRASNDSNLDDNTTRAATAVALARHSPTLVRSFDPNDPQVRERQRTMDVDMALQLSRARRETMVSSVGVSSPFEALLNHQQHQSSLEHGVFPVALEGEHDHYQRESNGNRINELDVEGSVDGDTLAPRRSRSHPSLHNAHQSHQHGTHSNSNLLSNLANLNTEDPSSSTFGLPTYQANVSRSNFDFARMEEFAAVEKANLGIGTPILTRFAPAPVHMHINHIPDSNYFPQPVATAESAVGSSSSQQPRISVDDSIQQHQDQQRSEDILNGQNSLSQRPLRHRKLSQSNSSRPRPRKGIGGKISLFESAPTEPVPRLPPFPSSNPSHGAVIAGYDYSIISPNHPTNPNGGGILNPSASQGHDRPYRFSFYSNALSATIHARSLSELPAEGQTFEDLFAGIQPPHPPPPFQASTAGTIVPPPKDRPTSSLAFTPPMTTQGWQTPVAGGNGNLMGHRSVPSDAASVYVNGLRRSGAPEKGGEVDNGNGGDSDANTWWLDVTCPTDEEMKMLSKVFSIHPLTTEDILMEETREKIELFRNYYLVCFRSFDQDPYSPTHLEPLNMYIIVFREGTLSFHFRPTPHPQNVRRRIKQLKDYISVTSDWISYALIDDITDAFGPLIQNIEYEVDSIDELVLILKEAEQSDMLRRIGTCRKKVMGLLRLMGNKADVVKGLAKRCNENWRVAPTSDIGLYLSDIQDHLITMTQNLNHYEKILSRSHSNYLAQISIEMTDANNQINDVLSKLTALGTVLIPMNLVTGLWGMNVHVPGEGTPGYAWFVSIIACLAAFALIGGYSTYKFMVRR